MPYSGSYKNKSITSKSSNAKIKEWLYMGYTNQPLFLLQEIFKGQIFVNKSSKDKSLWTNLQTKYLREQIFKGQTSINKSSRTMPQFKIEIEKPLGHHNSSSEAEKPFGRHSSGSEVKKPLDHLPSRSR